MTRRSTIIGTGSALPPRRVTNAELAERVETTHEWIVERTGIEARHIAADGETMYSSRFDHVPHLRPMEALIDPAVFIEGRDNRWDDPANVCGIQHD